MLLSLPTWIIHLLTVTEWLAAALLFHRYGVVTGRPALRWFAWAMLPHLLGGGTILAFHASGDTADGLLALARLLTFAGSLALLVATLALLPTQPRGRKAARPWGPRLAALVLIGGGLWGAARLLLNDSDVRALLPGTHLAYLTFLGLLLWLHRREPGLIPPLSILGFWFLLPFVVVTLIATHIATVRLGLPSLAHADALHGASEALLSVGNLLIATGVWRRLHQAGRDRTQTGTDGQG